MTCSPTTTGLCLLASPIYPVLEDNLAQAYNLLGFDQFILDNILLHPSFVILKYSPFKHCCICATLADEPSKKRAHRIILSTLLISEAIAGGGVWTSTSGQQRLPSFARSTLVSRSSFPFTGSCPRRQCSLPNSVAACLPFLRAAFDSLRHLGSFLPSFLSKGPNIIAPSGPHSRLELSGLPQANDNQSHKH